MNQVLLLLACCTFSLLYGVRSAGIGDNDRILTTIDLNNPHVVNEILTTTAVSCYIKASYIQGSVLTMTCPDGCDDVTDSLFGSGVYSDDSYVCAAAIHDGRISAKQGGKITIRKTPGQSSHIGSTAFNITSQSSKDSPGSFIFLNAFEGRQSLYAVSCLARGDFTDEKDFLIICPAGCDAMYNGVWGTELYSPDSYLCGAGIHAGKIQAFTGGRIVVHRVSGGQDYKASYQNGIRSRNAEPTTSSITMQECPQDLSGVLSVGCSIQADHIMEEVFSVICPPGCSQSYSKVIGKGPYSVSSTICGAAVHDGFIQEPLGGRVTVYKTPGLQSFGTIRRNGITSEQTEIPGRGFIVQDSIHSFPSLLEVTCQTSASSILEDIFTILCPSGCSKHKKTSLWGTNVYTQNSSICMAAIHDGQASDNGGPVTVRKLDGQKYFTGSLQHEIQSQTATNEHDGRAFVLGGNLEEVKSALTVSCDFTAQSTYGIQFTVRCPKTCEIAARNADSQNVKRLLEMDEAICKEAGDVAGKVVTVRRVPGELVYSGSFQEFIRHSNPNVVDLSRGQVVVYENHFDHPQILSVSWDMKADQIHTDTGTVVCPPKRNSSDGQMFGSGIYTDDSQICWAALHDGRINVDGGKTTVRKTPGLWTYIGSENAGFTSQSRDRPWDASIVFQSTFYHMATTFTLTCDTLGYMIEDDEYGVVCPFGCLDGYSTSDIYGDHIYADNSPICVAAIQAGKITNEGGRLVVKSMPGQSSYKSGTFNGITSLEYGESDGSFMFK